ncbi:MAG: DUF7714 family protein [Sporichthyaceae bacterium]
MLAHRLALPPPNTRSHPYRGLSMQEVDIPLTESAMLAFLDGREVYRRTEFLVLRNGEDTALLQVAKDDFEPLFAPVTDAILLAAGEDIAYVEDPSVDVGNATALAKAAVPGKLATVVVGMFSHVNFIYRPQPIPIRVTEVVPPYPPKLFAQATQVIEFDEDLPPIELILDAVQVSDLVDANPAHTYLLPCRGSGSAPAGATGEVLDTRPADRKAWLMIGCERSMQFHRHFYGDEPPQVDLCPKARLGKDADYLASGDFALIKCCMLERGLEVDDRSVVVPWGANLDEIRLGLRRLLLGEEGPPLL